MARIPIDSSSSFFLVDPEKEDIFNQYSWCLNDNGYAVAITDGEDKIYAHHLAFSGSQYEGRFREVHHKNVDPLDNRRANLIPIKNGSRAGKKLQATVRSKFRTMNGNPTTSKYVGVSWHKDNKKWYSRYKDLDGNHCYLGLFESEEAASEAYQERVKEVVRALEEIVFMEWEDDRL